MIHLIKLSKKYRSALMFPFIMFIAIPGFAQNPGGSSDWKLETIPVNLETEFALSALPAHLRKDATVYLLDTEKGYYIARQGSNGFICFVARTEWEWAEFRKDLTTPISYDAEGAKTIFPVYQDVAAMRASGKFTALQIKDSIIDRINKGIYKAPSRPGISYMLAPIMRVYPAMPDNKNIVTMSMPHYMFYAPYITNTDVGIKPDAHQGPMLVNPDQWVLGERKGPHGYIILPADEAEKAKIMDESKELVKRLVAYKAYFKVNPGGMHHGN